MRIKMGLLLIVLIFTSSPFASAKQNVVFIHSYDPQYKWVKQVTEGFRKVIGAESEINVFMEYMDAKRFPLTRHRDAFYYQLLEKYKEQNINAIVVSDDPALEMLRIKKNDWMHQLPLVYMGINRVTDEVLSMQEATGIFEYRDLLQTIAEMRQIFQTDEIILLSDKTSTGIANLSIINEGMELKGGLENIYVIEQLKVSAIEQRFESLPETIPVFVIGQLYDDINHRGLITPNDGLSLLSKSIRNPLITIEIPSTASGGALAGHNLSGVEHGTEVAKILLSVLNGTPASEIPPKIDTSSTWYFNWQLMKVYGLTKKDTPLSSQFVFGDKSIYVEYKAFVIGASLALLVALVIIFLLVLLVRRSKSAQNTLAKNESRYKALALEGANVFWETDSNGRITYVYGDTQEMFRIDHSDIIGNKLLSTLTQNPANSFPGSMYNACVAKKQPIHNLVGKIYNRSFSEKVIVVSASVKLNSEDKFDGYRGIIKEVTGEYALSEQIAYEASHDSLTGLLNRNAFNMRFKEILNAIEVTQVNTYLCFLDLDSFKIVNDTIGHMAGDNMLSKIASVISKCVSNDDTLARLGGDEFALILANHSEREAHNICENVISHVASYKLYWNRNYYSVGCSIGMVPVRANSSYEELLSHADLACYKAKDLGKGRVYYSTEDDSDIASEQVQMGHIANLRQALESNRFFFVKQLIKPVDPSDKLLKYEILLRYIGDDKMLVPPSLFIPMAEKHGLITLLDKWVIQRALTDYSELFEKDNAIISLNVSGTSLSNADFLNDVLDIVTSIDVDLSKICFEITETAVVSNIERAQEFIRELKKFGCLFSLDDFGSGSSSYGYLKNLSVDFLKIDGSLIKSIDKEFIDESIVRSINQIAHQMNIKTVAEFVENDKVLKVLENIKVDYVQGFGIHKPEACRKELIPATTSRHTTK